jgi:hypothetical protein
MKVEDKTLFLKPILGKSASKASQKPAFSSNTLRITNNTAQEGFKRSITLAAKAYTFSFYMDKGQQDLNDKEYYWVELFNSTNMNSPVYTYTTKVASTGYYTFNYTVPTAGTYVWRFRRISLNGRSSSGIAYFDDFKVSYTIQQSQQVCSSPKNYRFGFNTQEKDDEVYGAGNLNTAEFWEYDTRIGRRWNVDPIYNAWESRYAVNGNNPNFFSDPLGNYKTKLGAKIANFFSKDKGEVLQAKTGKHKGEWFRGVADKENGGNVTRIFGGKNSSSSVDNVVDFAEHFKFANSEEVTFSLGIQAGGSINLNSLKLNLEGGLMTRDFFKASINPMADKNLASAEFISENKMHNYFQGMGGLQNSSFSVGGKLDYNFLYYNSYYGLRMEEGTGKFDVKGNIFKYSFGPKLKIAPPIMTSGMSTTLTVDDGKKFYGLELGISAKLILGIDYKMKFGIKY